MRDLHEETLETASDLVKSKLRYHVYKCWGDKTSNTDKWGTLWKVERGFVAAHREVWTELLASRWDLSAGNPPELLDLIAQALDQAVVDLTLHFEALPPDWVAAQFDEWKESFTPESLIAEGT